MSEESFDYIIVGAGSAGCVLANRLSADPKNDVLLLEAGGDDRPLHNPKQFWSNLMIHTPIGFGKTLNDKHVNWLYETEVDQGSGGRRHKWPKGKVLGGSSSINGLLYIRGQHADYDGWRQMGCEGWSYADVLPYFRRAEHQERGEDEYHGVGGPLNVSDFTEQHPISAALLEAAVEAGIPRSDDINGAEQEGVTWFQCSIKNGKRHSTAVGYLHPVMGRPNLKVKTEAQTTRILFEGKRAVGVEYHAGADERTSRKARREVILAAGAVASPQLLEVSGIGRGDMLAEARHPRGARTQGRRREPAGPLHDRLPVAAEARMRHRQRTVARLRTVARDPEILHGAPRAADLPGGAHRGVLQIAARARAPRHPVPHDGGVDGPGNPRQDAGAGAGEGARPHLHAVPGAA